MTIGHENEEMLTIGHRSQKSGSELDNKKIDWAFKNVKPKDWYLVLNSVYLSTGLGFVRLRG